MIFGAINYLNLLPFAVFLKKELKYSHEKMALHYNKGVPSEINHRLKRSKIDAGFVSSVVSKDFRCSDLGIIANKRVYSVLVIEGKNRSDKDSATSNILAKILKIEGEVIIGDKALQFYLKNGDIGVDLAQEWYKQTQLPFVFGRLCFGKKLDKKRILSLTLAFKKQKIKIPQYILKAESSRRNISSKELLWYLSHINYKLEHKSLKSLRLFLKMSQKVSKNIEK